VYYILQGTFGRKPQAKPEDDRYLRAAIQEYDNIAKLGQIMREGPVKVRDTQTHNMSSQVAVTTHSCWELIFLLVKQPLVLRCCAVI
jgi:hypothetical protein